MGLANYARIEWGLDLSGSYLLNLWQSTTALLLMLESRPVITSETSVADYINSCVAVERVVRLAMRLLNSTTTKQFIHYIITTEW